MVARKSKNRKPPAKKQKSLVASSTKKKPEPPPVDHEEESSSSSESESSELKDTKTPPTTTTSRRGTKQSSVATRNNKSKDDSDESESEEDDKAQVTMKKAGMTKDEDDDDDSSNGDGSSDDSSSSSDQDVLEEEDAPAFSDQNASWLKPKKKSSNLLESDDSDGESDGDVNDKDHPANSDDEKEDDEEEDEMLEVEKEARLVDREIEEERHDAEEEMKRTIRDHTSIYHLPTPAELELNVDRVVPPSEIRSHIDSILEVLADFKTRRQPGRSRKEYVDQLGSFIAELYGYLPELVEYFLLMFGPAETLEFVEQSDQPRPLVIRTNTLKTRRKDLAGALMKRGVTLDPLASWSKVGLKIVESPVPIGATPEYLSGHYMLQSAASMCAVMALSPEPNERVLDVSAAPGGKTSYIAQLMRNTGVIIANDLKAERQKATVANLHRLGVKNVVACKHDGRKVGTLFHNRFDRVLLDAPCSGLGVISRDPSVKVQRTMADVQKCAHLQKELLLAAIDALKFKGTTGGVMVYSTCSVSVAENEEVVNYALSKRDIRLIDTGLDFGKPGFTRFQDKRFHPSVALTRRFYPHVHNMDGFFVAKIQKMSDGRPGQVKSANVEEEKVDQDVLAAEEEGDNAVKAEDNKIKSRSSNGPNKKRKRKEGDNDNKAKSSNKTKNPLVSVPPTKPKAKKQKQNAKTTKPRRSRAATDA